MISERIIPLYVIRRLSRECDSAAQIGNKDAETMNPLFTPYLQRWRLEQDGKAFETHSSLLMPVRYRGAAAMLKTP